MKGLTIVVLAAALALASANCPLSCSGHGTCGANDKCTCYPNWQGLDCADRTCMFAISWADVPSADETAHAYTECSSKGICDRKSGTCKCFAGYEGEACRRSSCPNGCSGHGTCEYLNDLAGDAAVQVGGAAGRLYRTSWDAKKTQLCKCDPGFSDVDCSKRMCPTGDDPLTTSAMAKEVQTVTVGDGDAAGTTITGQYTLSYTDMFNNVWTTRPITAVDAGTASADIAASTKDVEYALESLPNHAIEDVVVTQATGSIYVVYSITFNGQHTLGNQPQLTCDKVGCNVDGCQPRFAGIGGGSIPTCTVATTTQGTHDTATCSGRGDCDHATGLCTCNEGYTDEDCSLQTVLL